MSHTHTPSEEYRTCAESVAPPGWFCTRVLGHDGPCAAHPTYDRYETALTDLQITGLCVIFLILGSLLGLFVSIAYFHVEMVQ